MGLKSVFTILGVAVFCISCGSSKGALDVPASKGTAAQLSGTKWESDAGVITFLSDKDMEFLPRAASNKRLPPLDKPLTGHYIITEGMVSGLVGGNIPLSGTWDGKTLVIPGAHYAQVK